MPQKFMWKYFLMPRGGKIHSLLYVVNSSQFYVIFGVSHNSCKCVSYDQLFQSLHKYTIPHGVSTLNRNAYFCLSLLLNVSCRSLKADTKESPIRINAISIQCNIQKCFKNEHVQKQLLNLEIQKIEDFVILCINTIVVIIEGISVGGFLQCVNIQLCSTQRDCLS